MIRDQETTLQDLTFTQRPNGAIELRANTAFRERLKQRNDYAWREAQVGQWVCQAGWDLRTADTLLAMSEAPVLIDDHHAILDDGKYVIFPEGRLWWFPNYMKEDFTKTLRDTGVVVFDAVPVDPQACRDCWPALNHTAAWLVPETQDKLPADQTGRPLLWTQVCNAHLIARVPDLETADEAKLHRMPAVPTPWWRKLDEDSAPTGNPTTPTILPDHLGEGPELRTVLQAVFRKYLDISTAHVPPPTSDDFRPDVGPHRLTRHEYGWFVTLMPAESLPDSEEQEPDWFRPVGNLARREGCSIVNFDQDGDVHPDLPTFDW